MFFSNGLKASLSVIAFCLLLSGCGSNVHLYPYDTQSTKNSFQRGFVFYLPKTTVTKITYTYSLYKAVFSESNQPPIYFTRLEKPIDITTGLVQDPTLAFKLDLEDLRAFSVDTKTAFIFDDQALLNKITSTTSDKSADIIKGVTKTAINIARMSAGVRAMCYPEPSEVTYIDDFTVSEEIDSEDWKPFGDSETYNFSNEKIKQYAILMTDKTIAFLNKQQAILKDSIDKKDQSLLTSLMEQKIKDKIL